MSRTDKLRLFTDSNVVTAGVLSAWGLDKAILSLCAAGICKLILADAVRAEVEQNLLLHAQGLSDHAAARLLEDYDHTLRLCAPEAVPFPHPSRIAANRHLIRHAADVPILLSALDSRPDWVLTNNVKHFTPEVAARSGLRIATPAEFFRRVVWKKRAQTE
jgi:predicted nucleic acid-binding protein